jgi:hypothetical protein
MYNHKKIIRQEIWRAVTCPNFEDYPTHRHALDRFLEWHATQKWPNPKIADAARETNSQSELNRLAINSLSKGLRLRLGYGE